MDFANHPCFNAETRHKTGRIHLPVAPKCNVQCNFCNRKFDCVNESRPGVTSSVLKPAQAIGYLGSVLEKVDNLAVVGIAGPGDPFANPEETMATLRLVHERYPEKILCLATNGLGLLEYVSELATMNISHVTVTVNAVDPVIGAQVYSWIRFGAHTYRGVEGARLLIDRQAKAIQALKSAGITVKINTVVIPGVNFDHLVDIAKRMGELGADVHNCIPLMHVEGTAFEGVASPDPGLLQSMRFEAGKFLKQISHCSRCRADAVGLLGQENDAMIQELLSDATSVKPNAKRPYVAVATREGLFVNQHLGEATGLWLFGLENGAPKLIGRRPTPVPGAGDGRWEEMAELYSDCFAILASGFGKTPETILGTHGIKVIAAECLITEAAGALLEGKEIPKVLLRMGGSCGVGNSCGGTGMGCA